MFVFLELSTLYPNDRLMRICDGHEHLSAVPEAIKFEEKPTCVKIDI